jgi:hypothetical protein
MSPGDFNEKEACEKVLNELLDIMSSEGVEFMCEVEINSDRKWWQFWKPKFIYNWIEK